MDGGVGELLSVGVDGLRDVAQERVDARFVQVSNSRWAAGAAATIEFTESMGASLRRTSQRGETLRPRFEHAGREYVA